MTARRSYAILENSIVTEQQTTRTRKNKDVEARSALALALKTLGEKIEKKVGKRASSWNVGHVVDHKKGNEPGRREQQRDSGGGIMRRSFFAVSLFGLFQDGFSHLNKGACVVHALKRKREKKNSIETTTQLLSGGDS